MYSYKSFRRIEIFGIVFDFIGALVLATAVLRYTHNDLWHEGKAEIEYIDKHLEDTKRIAIAAVSFLVMGFLMTLIGVLGIRKRELSLDILLNQIPRRKLT